MVIQLVILKINDSKGLDEAGRNEGEAVEKALVGHYFSMTGGVEVQVREKTARGVDWEL